MSVMMTSSNGISNYDDDFGGHGEFGCYEDAARSVEIVREELKDGQLGSFGITIVQERPARIGTVIPGGPADRAGLKKGDLVLAVNGEDITKLSHKEVTNIIKATKTQNVWLSVCESDEVNSSFSSNHDGSMYKSTPSILTESYSSNTPLRRIHQLQSTLAIGSPHNGSGDIYLRGRGDPRRQSPTGRKLMASAEPNYVTLVPPQSFTVTRMSTLVLYCGPVKIPTSWSSRGVSSLCIQECARQLFAKRKMEDSLKVQLEVSQTSLRISNMTGSVLAKHRRRELYYCGSCTNDDQCFAVVSKTDSDGPSGPMADLCHIFKLLPDTRLSTYVIDRSKSSKEVRSGSPVLVKSCVDITETIQNIFQNESQPRMAMEKTGSTDNLEYGIVRGISTLQLASGLMNSSPEQASPLLKRKKSNVIDLRTKRGSPTAEPRHRRNRSISNPSDPATLFTQRTLQPSSSAGYIPTNGGEAVHLRMHSDGTTHPFPSSTGGSNSSVRGRSNLLHSSLPREDAKRISDCSFSSMSSDHSGGHRSSTSRSGSPSSSPNKSQSPTPVPPPISREVSPHRSKLIGTRKTSAQSRGGAISPSDAAMYGSKMQLRRQGSEGSVYDLTAQLQMSPYHHFGMPAKNGLSSSVDSIVTITTLAEDDIDLVVGRVAGWCGSFDKLLTDPLGLQCFLQFLESEHSEENLLFWKDVEEYKKMPQHNLIAASKKIYDEYLSSSAPRLINIDGIVNDAIKKKMDTPTASLFDDAQKEIYHLMRMDCYPRFQKSPIIKESLMAEMEGRPLPIETNAASAVQPAKQVTQQWGKKKPSLLDRLKGVSAKPHLESPLTKQSTAATNDTTPPSPNSDRSPSSSSSFNSFSSLTHSLAKSSERRRSKKEKKEVKKTASLTTEAQGYHPEDNLKHLQAHKGNLFEINLPNRVSKIIEAPPKATVREALVNVLKKYNYSLDVMEVRLTSTLQTISVDSPASVLIGKHVSIMRSKHTVTASFPDIPETIMLADGSTTVRVMFDQILSERSKTDPYSVYVDGARAPLELDMTSSVLDGHTVTVKYLPPSTPSSVTTSIPRVGTSAKELEDLFSEIARLSADTLSDQRTVQEDPQKVKRSPKLFQKKTKKDRSSPKFTRTKSGATVSHTSPAVIPQPRSLSPPPSFTGSLPPRSYFPQPPASDPPNLSHVALNRPYGQWEYNHPSYHQHQRSGDAMSGVSMDSGSSVDSITHELSADRRMANRMQLGQWIMQSQTSMASYGTSAPNYFPTALGSMDTLERTHPGVSGKVSSLSREQAAMMRNYLKRGEQSDTIVTDAYSQRQQHQPNISQLGSMGALNAGGIPSSNYPWKTAQLRMRRHPSDHGSVVSDEGQQFSDCSSLVSNTSSSRGGMVPSNQRQQPPLSPTTHVLVVEESQSSETYV